jgi:hypothetical protein
MFPVHGLTRRLGPSPGELDLQSMLCVASFTRRVLELELPLLDLDNQQSIMRMERSISTAILELY